MAYSGDAFQQPEDLVPVRTADGSFTLDSRHLGEHYHSLHGAAAESRHVYIRNGLCASVGRKLAVLEVGLGTGLNALLTWTECVQRNLQVDYVALEPFPVPQEVRAAMAHERIVGGVAWKDGFEAMMTAPPGVRQVLSGGFAFCWQKMRVQQLEERNAFDLVFYDAFAPRVQPAMWTGDVFGRVARAMRTGGLLVTYCASGNARRAMAAAGLQVERLAGPPGKREMVRAWKRG